MGQFKDIVNTPRFDLDGNLIVSSHGYPTRESAAQAFDDFLSSEDGKTQFYPCDPDDIGKWPVKLQTGIDKQGVMHHVWQWSPNNNASYSTRQVWVLIHGPVHRGEFVPYRLNDPTRKLATHSELPPKLKRKGKVLV